MRSRLMSEHGSARQCLQTMLLTARRSCLCDDAGQEVSLLYAACSPGIIYILLHFPFLPLITVHNVK